MVFTIYGHGGHLEFQIMTHFSLILYIHHINAKYEISLKLAQYFYRKCHLKFFMYPKFCVIFFKLYPTHSRSVYDPTGMILAILYSKVPHMLHAKYQPNWHSGSGEEVV